MQKFLITGLFFITVLGLGCGKPASRFSFETRRPAGQLLQDFDIAWWNYTPDGQIVCVFESDENIAAGGGSRRVRQVMVLRTFWLPKKGETTTDPSTANMNLDLLARVDEESGLYRGAGFAYITEKNDREIEVAVRRAQLRLTDKTVGFRSSFEKTQATGTAVAVYSPDMVESMLGQFEQQRREMGRK